MKSFRLFWRAVKSTRHEMWVSVQVLVAVTLVLSLILYLVEHNAQPEVFHSYWDALLWSFMGYIGDPGEFATYTPITFWGRVLKIACAIVNIAIFAVPAGLVAGGFSEAIADDKRERELAAARERILRLFRRKLDKLTKFRHVPRYKSLADIQLGLEMDTKDIMDAVSSSDCLRLRNLADAIPDVQNPADRLVVETIPMRPEWQRSYGCCIDRNSRVTIIAPTSATEVALGHFSFYLALFGGFNYISRECKRTADAPENYYLIEDPESSEAMKEYLADIKRLGQGPDHWDAVVIASDSVHPEGLHFVTHASEKVSDTGSTLLDRKEFEKMYEAVAEKMKTDFDIETEENVRYLKVGSKNILNRLGGGKSANAFILRVDWKLAAFDRRHVAIAYALACEMARTLEARELSPQPEWKAPGYGY